MNCNNTILMEKLTQLNIRSKEGSIGKEEQYE